MTLAIGELRRLMQEASDLSTIEEHFDTVLLPNEAFMKLGVLARNDVLLSLVLSVLKLSFGIDTPPVQGQLTHVVEHGLWHGIWVFNSGAFARVIYFEDSRRALYSFATLASPLAHYYRLCVPETDVPVDPEHVMLAHVARRDPSGKPN